MKQRKTTLDDPGSRDLHEFRLIVSGFDELTDELEGAILNAGCDDALLGIQCGVPFLEFEREAASFEEAVLSAIHDVENAGAGLQVLRVEPDDLVNASEIARRVGRTRQLISLYARGERGPGGFPRPMAVHSRDVQLWKWADVAAWFERNGIAETASVRNARPTAIINGVLELRRYVPSTKALMELWKELKAPQSVRSRAG
jgi:hypothetical protein